MNPDRIGPSQVVHDMDSDTFVKFMIHDSKRRYDVEAEADRAVTRIRRYGKGEGASRMRTYRCQFELDGIHWHLTTKKKKK